MRHACTAHAPACWRDDEAWQRCPGQGAAALQRCPGQGAEEGGSEPLSESAADAPWLPCPPGTMAPMSPRHVAPVSTHHGSRVAQAQVHIAVPIHVPKPGSLRLLHEHWEAAGAAHLRGEAAGGVGGSPGGGAGAAPAAQVPRGFPGSWAAADARQPPRRPGPGLRRADGMAWVGGKRGWGALAQQAATFAAGGRAAPPAGG
jgi:hypothetical protein